MKDPCTGTMNGTTGDVKRNGPKRELSDFEEFVLVNLVLTKPGLYLREMQHELYLCMLATLGRFINDTSYSA